MGPPLLLGVSLQAALALVLPLLQVATHATKKKVHGARADHGCTSASLLSLVYSTGVATSLASKSQSHCGGSAKLSAGGGSTAAPTHRVTSTTSLLASWKVFLSWKSSS